MIHLKLRHIILQRQPMFITALLSIFVLMSTTFFLWANLAKVENIVQSQGKIETVYNPLVAAAPADAMIADILVQEGESVTKNQPLVLLKDDALNQEIEALTLSLSTIEAEIGRLSAAVDHQDQPVFTAEFIVGHQDLAQDQNKLFFKNREAHATQLQKADEDVAQKLAIWDDLTKRVQRLEVAFEKGRTQKSDLIPLPKTSWGITNTQWNNLTRLQQLSFIKGRLDEARAAENRSLAILSEARLQKKLLDKEIEVANIQSLITKRSEQTAIEKKLESLTTAQAALTVRAPQDGTVAALYETQADVQIYNADPLVSVAPLDREVLVEVYVPTYDLSAISIGQTAAIIVDVPFATQKSFVDGKINAISANPHFTDRAGIPYYKVTVMARSQQFETQRLEDLTANVQFYAGSISVKDLIIRTLNRDIKLHDGVIKNMRLAEIGL